MSFLYKWNYYYFGGKDFFVNMKKSLLTFSFCFLVISVFAQPSTRPETKPRDASYYLQKGTRQKTWGWVLVAFSGSIFLLAAAATDSEYEESNGARIAMGSISAASGIGLIYAGTRNKRKGRAMLSAAPSALMLPGSSHPAPGIAMQWALGAKKRR